jgi:hypothetical protein
MIDVKNFHVKTRISIPSNFQLQKCNAKEIPEYNVLNDAPECPVEFNVIF